MHAYIYNATHDRVSEHPTRRKAMAEAKRLAGRGARFVASRCHGTDPPLRPPARSRWTSRTGSPMLHP